MSLNEFLDFVCILLLLFFAVKTDSQGDTFIEGADYAPKSKSMQESSDCHCIYIRRCPILRYRKDWRTAGETCEFGYGEYRRVCCPSGRRRPKTEVIDQPSPRATAPPTAITTRSFQRMTETTPGPINSDVIYCGHSRHTHGIDPAEGSWPWMVAIKKREPSGVYEFFCSGFLISRKHVVSAAHCYEKKDLDQYRARIGSINQNQGDEYRITSIVVHPGYTAGLFYDNIAVLTLDREVNFLNFNPICLPDKHVSRMDLVGRGTTLVGWGSDKPRGKHRIYLKQLMGMRVVSNEQCERIFHTTLKSGFEQHFPRGLTRGMICAGFKEGGKDACMGDSGAPLMIQHSHQWFAIGFVSFGYSCGLPGIPGGYTKVSNYLDWIQSEIHHH